MRSQCAALSAATSFWAASYISSFERKVRPRVLFGFDVVMVDGVVRPKTPILRLPLRMMACVLPVNGLPVASTMMLADTIGNFACLMRSMVTSEP